MNGFVNVLKPVGATASDVVVCLRHVLKEKRIGHLGTLDPGASGVLPIAIGQATKLFDYLTAKRKYYRAFFTFGKTTDTLDAYGRVTERSDNIPTVKQLQKALDSFVGEQQQIPPAYSAISVGGVRAYKLARNGEDIALRARSVQVFVCKLVRQIAVDTFAVDIECSGGTYIRSLARDIALSCNSVGYMSGLIRLQSGCFDINSAYTLDEIRNTPEICVLPIEYPLRDIEPLVLDEKFYFDLDNGRPVACPSFTGYRKVYCGGVFWGLGIYANGAVMLRYYLKNAE